MQGRGRGRAKQIDRKSERRRKGGAPQSMPVETVGSIPAVHESPVRDARAAGEEELGVNGVGHALAVTEVNLEAVWVVAENLKRVLDEVSGPVARPVIFQVKHKVRLHVLSHPIQRYDLPYPFLVA